MSDRADPPNPEHVPGMHDPVAKAALLKKSNDDMRQRIALLKQEVRPTLPNRASCLHSCWCAV